MKHARVALAALTTAAFGFAFAQSPQPAAPAPKPAALSDALPIPPPPAPKTAAAWILLDYATGKSRISARPSSARSRAVE
jgi:D-alanyl-D-alanine carboxypeptidase (penicillin-binding protein 5/6)